MTQPQPFNTMPTTMPPIPPQWRGVGSEWREQRRRHLLNRLWRAACRAQDTPPHALFVVIHFDGPGGHLWHLYNNLMASHQTPGPPRLPGRYE
jgi:hypothetical protein